MCLVIQSCLTLCDPVDCSSPGYSVHGDSPGKNTGVDWHDLFQGISPIRDGTQVSLTAGGVFAFWVTREAHSNRYTLFFHCGFNLYFHSSSHVWQRRQWQPTPILLPGKSHGQRSLVGCSPLGHEESDKTERLHFHFSLSCIGEGNGNPLQCSCLENPRDGGAWWAAIYGVAQSQTQLKRLSSSSHVWM